MMKFTVYITFILAILLCSHASAQIESAPMQSMQALEDKVPDSYSAENKTVQTFIKEASFQRFEILFDFNSYKLNGKASKDLTSVLDYLLTSKEGYRILLVGTADRVGNVIYNQNLALNRANLVRNYLIKNGVPADLIELRAIGEDFPDIVTKKGDQQQLNRIVGIYVAKNADSSIFTDTPLPLITNKIYIEEVETLKAKKRGAKR